MIHDPSAVAVHNGQFLGLDVPVEESKIVLLPIPWDVTTSYRPGTVWGPEAVLNASYQLDLFSPYKDEIWNLPLHTLEISDEWVKRSKTLRTQSQAYIDFLEEGGIPGESAKMQEILAETNETCRKLHEWSQQVAREHLSQGRRILTVGGDHSVSLGPILAAADHFGDISVLHFDAHADLRNAYEGFEDSHASIMFNVMKNPKISKLVQIGIRDVSSVEVEFIKSNDKVKTYFDWDLRGRQAEGESWKQICDEVVKHLGPQVYISFDIDGLDPKLCPNTGTPVPGGLELFEATYLIQAVVKSGRKIIGGDLVEVAPGPDGDEWDGNVGARAVFQIAIAMAQSL